MSDEATLEFTVEPFAPDNPGPHVTASIDAARSVASAVEVGPFGTTARGRMTTIAEITRAIVDAALSNGATRVSLQVSVETGRDTEQAAE